MTENMYMVDAYYMDARIVCTPFPPNLPTSDEDDALLSAMGKKLSQATVRDRGGSTSSKTLLLVVFKFAQAHPVPIIVFTPTNAGGGYKVRSALCVCVCLCMYTNIHLICSKYNCNICVLSESLQHRLMHATTTSKRACVHACFWCSQIHICLG